MKKLVREHINEKFISDSDSVRDMGIGDPLRHIVIRDIYSMGIKQIYILLRLRDDGYWAEIYNAGTISQNFNKTKKYATFIHNTKGNNIGIIKSTKSYPESYRKPTEQEISLIKDALKEEVSQKYLDLIEEKTGIDLRV